MMAVAPKEWEAERQVSDAEHLGASAAGAHEVPAAERSSSP